MTTITTSTTSTPNAEARKAALFAALHKWVSQRPGLEFCNYGDWTAYRAEMRSITKDLHHARELLRVAQWALTADDIIKAATSGRLTIKEPAPGVFTLDYCTGQYWCTEYRPAVSRVLASALWDCWRTMQGEGATCDTIRQAARRNLSRSVCRAYFR